MNSFYFLEYFAKFHLLAKLTFGSVKDRIDDASDRKDTANNSTDTCDKTC